MSIKNILEIDNKINEVDFRSLIEIDYFEAIDLYILTTIIEELLKKTISHKDVNSIIRNRFNTHWYDKFKEVYESVLYASEFFHEISSMSLGMMDFEDALKIYPKSWFKIDQLYRKFIFHYKKSSQPTLLSEIAEMIENKYENDFLLRLNDAWQNQLGSISDWKSLTIISQRSFYDNYIQNLRKKHNKAIVIISDALRYEIGEELQRKFLKGTDLKLKLNLCCHLYRVTHN